MLHQVHWKARVRFLKDKLHKQEFVKMNAITNSYPPFGIIGLGGEANLTLEYVAAHEANFWSFDRTTATGQSKIDLATSSDNVGNGKTSAARQRRDLENGTISAAVVARTWPEISSFGGRSCPLGQLNKLVCGQGLRLWRL